MGLLIAAAAPALILLRTGSLVTQLGAPGLQATLTIFSGVRWKAVELIEKAKAGTVKKTDADKTQIVDKRGMAISVVGSGAPLKA
jgi:hypothetical protein